MKSNLLPWLLILASLGLSLWTRYSLVEQAEFGFFCDGGGASWLCPVRWAIVQSFNSYGLGYFALFLGLLATVTRSASVALAAGVVGMMGLVLYNWDYSALGFLLGALALARAQFEDYRHQHGTGQQQA
ncbi:MAG: hypothetical protein ACXWUF_05175 [Methylomagnum sp.]